MGMVRLFSHPSKTIQILRLAWLTLASQFLVSGIGNAKPVGTVQIINSNAGRLITAHADQYDNKVYIGGLAYRPLAPAIGAHVHVWGLDKNNHLVFFKTTSVLFTGNPSLIHTASYIVSVTLAMMRKTNIVYATFHNLSHADSRKEK